MPEEGDTGPVPIAAEIPRLAEIFVRFDQALNPESRDAKVAEVTFERETDELYTRLCSEHLQLRSVTIYEFRAFVRLRCRGILSKN